MTLTLYNTRGCEQVWIGWLAHLTMEANGEVSGCVGGLQGGRGLCAFWGQEPGRKYQEAVVRPYGANCRLLKGGQLQRGEKEERRVEGFSPVSWSSGVTGISCSCCTTCTRARTQAQNSLLAPHHSNYGTIKTRWHLICCQFLWLNTANSSITFPLQPHSDFNVSPAPPQLSTCQPLIFPPSSFGRAQASFETTLSDTLPSTSLAHPLPILLSYFIYLFTLESALIQSVPFFPVSHVPLCIPPSPHTHASFSPPPKQIRPTFPTSVVRTTLHQDSFSTRRTRPSQQPVSKQGDRSSCN